MMASNKTPDISAPAAPEAAPTVQPGLMLTAPGGPPVRQPKATFEQYADRRLTWLAVAAPSIQTPEQLLDPDYWRPVAQRLSRFEHVVVTADHGGWEAELVVSEAGETAATMVLARVIELPPRAAAITIAGTDFRVEWRGEAARFTVIRVRDDHVMATGLATRAAALAALERLHPVRV